MLISLQIDRLENQMLVVLDSSFGSSCASKITGVHALRNEMRVVVYVDSLQFDRFENQMPVVLQFSVQFDRLRKIRCQWSSMTGWMLLRHYWMLLRRYWMLLRRYWLVPDSVYSWGAANAQFGIQLRRP